MTTRFISTIPYQYQPSLIITYTHFKMRSHLIILDHAVRHQGAVAEVVRSHLIILDHTVRHQGAVAKVVGHHDTGIQRGKIQSSNRLFVIPRLRVEDSGTFRIFFGIFFFKIWRIFFQKNSLFSSDGGTFGDSNSIW
jgi:hypothetical protein